MFIMCGSAQKQASRGDADHGFGRIEVNFLIVDKSRSGDHRAEGALNAIEQHSTSLHWLIFGPSVQCPGDSLNPPAVPLDRVISSTISQKVLLSNILVRSLEASSVQGRLSRGRGARFRFGGFGTGGWINLHSLLLRSIG
jgi:hypothetical protein